MRRPGSSKPLTFFALEQYEFGPGVGVSAGAATAVLTSESTLTPADLFAAADRAQYDAKRANLSHTVISGDLR